MTEIQTYLDQAAIFTPITVGDAALLLASERSATVFIGRETCPYCRRFVAKLSAVAQENDLIIYYLHSQLPTTMISKIQQLREQYNVPTVPGLLVAKNGEVKVKCDSSMTKEEILDFIND